MYGGLEGSRPHFSPPGLHFFPTFGLQGLTFGFYWPPRSCNCAGPPPNSTCWPSSKRHGLEIRRGARQQTPAQAAMGTTSHRPAEEPAHLPGHRQLHRPAQAHGTPARPVGRTCARTRRGAQNAGHPHHQQARMDGKGRSRMPSTCSSTARATPTLPAQICCAPQPAGAHARMSPMVVMADAPPSTGP